MKIEINSTIIDAKWDQFVDQHPQGNIFQTSAMFEVYQNTTGYQPFRFWATDNEKQIVLGVIMGVMIKEKGGLVGKLSARAIVQGGPLVADLPAKKKIVADLVQAFDSATSQEAIWSEIRNLTDTSADLSELNSFKLQGHLNFIIDLRPVEEEIWQRINQTQRKHIKRGQKLGVVMEEMTDMSQIPTFYHFLTANYARVKIPLADMSLFKNILKLLVPRKMARYVLAKVGKEYIGCRLTLMYKDQLYDWYAGVSSQKTNYYTNAVLIWEIFKWGKANGFHIFDFGGAGKPDEPYGPREFKRQFGGELTNFGWLVKINSSWKYNLVFFGLKVYQRLANLIRK